MVCGCVYLEMPECGHNKMDALFKVFSFVWEWLLNFSNKQKLLRVSFWMAIAILFAAPIDVFHFFLSIFHVLFEWIENWLDILITLVFGTSLHTTQVLVFYIIVAGILYGLYKLWLRFPDFYKRQKEHLLEFLSDEVESTANYWQESIINKIKLSIAAAALIFLLFI